MIYHKLERNLEKPHFSDIQPFLNRAKSVFKVNTENNISSKNKCQDEFPQENSEKDFSIYEESRILPFYEDLNLKNNFTNTQKNDSIKRKEARSEFHKIIQLDIAVRYAQNLLKNKHYKYTSTPLRNHKCYNHKNINGMGNGNNLEVKTFALNSGKISSRNFIEERDVNDEIPSINCLHFSDKIVYATKKMFRDYDNIKESTFKGIDRIFSLKSATNNLKNHGNSKINLKRKHNKCHCRSKTSRKFK